MLRKLLIGIIIGLVLTSCAWGAVDLYVTPSTATLERNGGNGRYNVTVVVKADTPTELDALGDIYLTYDLAVFDEIATADITDIGESYASWNASQLDLNYETNGTMRTIHYGKAGYLDSFVMLQNEEYPVFIMSMFVKNDAVTGDTLVSFIRAFSNMMEVGRLDDVLGEALAATYNITLDNTAPTSTIYPPGERYPTPQNVYIYTSEANDEALVHFTTNNGVTEVVTSDPTYQFNIPGIPDQVVITTVNYYAEDLAQDKAHNVETPIKQAVYIIDREFPVITITTYNSETLGEGDGFFVEFMVSEEIDSGTIVQVGGHDMRYDSGSGAGPFRYIVDINSQEIAPYTIYIKVYDLAGNDDENTSYNANLDLGGPTFEIHTTPDPAVVEEELLVTFSASEQLMDTPNVTVGLLTAEWASENLVVPEYTFRVTVSAYGWLLDIGPDTEPPYTFAHEPSANQTNIDPDASLSFRIADIGSGVSLSSLQIYIAHRPAVRDGVVHPDYQGTITYDGLGGYILDLQPKFSYPPNKEIVVEIYACDLSPSANALDPYVYSFYTSSGGELRLLSRPVAIPTVFDPRDGENTEIVYKLSQDSDIEVRIYNKLGTLIWNDIFEPGENGGQEGLNRVPWDGFNGYQMIESNDVYMFYVIEHGRKGKANVLGHGKVVILKD